MPVGGPGLVLLTLASIALLLVLILVVKLHAFLALLISSMALGLAAGMVPAAVLKSIQSGFGEALGFIAVVVGLGAMILSGIAVSLPMAILRGIIYGGWIAKRMFIPAPAMAMRPEVARPAGQTDAPPPVVLVALILLLPVLLIFAASIMGAANWPG